jgi:NTE family protein
VNVPGPDGTAHWYGDGGARLNSPLEPAIALGANGVVAIGLNSSVTPAANVAESEPDHLDGAAQMMQTAPADRLARDVARLGATNTRMVATNGTDATPYIFVAPKDRFVISRAAQDVYNRLYTGIAGLRRDPDVAILGRFADTGRSLVHGELYGYNFAAKEFVEELIALGRADADDWLSSTHDDGPWQVGATGAGADERPRVERA